VVEVEVEVEVEVVLIFQHGTHKIEEVIMQIMEI
jgi:hypothetical protein